MAAGFSLTYLLYMMVFVMSGFIMYSYYSAVGCEPTRQGLVKRLDQVIYVKMQNQYILAFYNAEQLLLLLFCKPIPAVLPCVFLDFSPSFPASSLSCLLLL